MAKLNVAQIIHKAKEIIAGSPGGIHYGDLVRRIYEENPETSENTIHGSVWDLHKVYPKEIQKPIRGLFVPVTPAGPKAENVVEKTDNQVLKESDFYEPFAEWLKNDLDEVTDSAALGGKGMEQKWGTPDVVGVYKPLASDLIKFPLEIVSAEIKINRQQPVVAFGQAVAYRLFSAKTYIAMPRTIAEEDKSRLEALCMLFGVGLVLFDLNPEDPHFTIQVSAQRFSPDMFYVNVFAKRLMETDAEQFENLFR